MKLKKILYAFITITLLGVAGFFAYQKLIVVPPQTSPEIFVAEAFKAIVPTWNEQAMIARQGPYMRFLDVEGKSTAKLFSIFRNLGAFKEAKPCKQVAVDTTFPHKEGVQSPVEAVSFHCATTFEKDTAQVIFLLGKENGKWGIAGLHVFSKYIDDMVKASQASH